MILDERLEFADALALNTGAPATFNLGDVIDTHGPAIGHATGLNVRRDLAGSSEPLYLVLSMQAAATSGGAATLQVALVSDDLSTPDLVTRTVHALTPVFALAALTANTIIAVIPLPSGLYERYVGIQQITGAFAFTGGSINAFLTNEPPNWRPYADNVA